MYIIKKDIVSVSRHTWINIKKKKKKYNGQFK